MPLSPYESKRKKMRSDQAWMELLDASIIFSNHVGAMWASMDEEARKAHDRLRDAFVAIYGD